jgi:hypothetical protein
MSTRIMSKLMPPIYYLLFELGGRFGNGPLLDRLYNRSRDNFPVRCKNQAMMESFIHRDGFRVRELLASYGSSVLLSQAVKSGHAEAVRVCVEVLSLSLSLSLSFLLSPSPHSLSPSSIGQVDAFFCRDFSPLDSPSAPFMTDILNSSDQIAVTLAKSASFFRSFRWRVTTLIIEKGLIFLIWKIFHFIKKQSPSSNCSRVKIWEVGQRSILRKWA